MTTPSMKKGGPISQIGVTVAASVAIGMYDLMYDTETSGVHKSAASFADLLTPAKNYMGFASKFAGVSLGARTTGETVAATNFPIATDCVIEMDCSSSTFEIDDLVSPVETSGGDALEAQKVAKTTSPAMAIGIVTRRYASATVLVEFRAISRKFTHGVPRSFPKDTATASEALSADRVLTTAEVQNRIIILDPNGSARNVDMPAVADNAGVEVWIRNAAGSALVLTIRHASAGATICTPTQNETAILRCDGTTWYGVAVFHN